MESEVGSDGDNRGTVEVVRLSMEEQEIGGLLKDTSCSDMEMSEEDNEENEDSFPSLPTTKSTAWSRAALQEKLVEQDMNATDMTGFQVAQAEEAWVYKI